MAAQIIGSRFLKKRVFWQALIKNKIIENEMNAKETEKLRPQILRQLAIINELFSDPSSIERIETYDNPFSPGNFKLLQKLADALMLKANPI